jgi:hypothetical protein
MVKHSYLKFIVLFILIAGCEEYKYSIEMKPCDEGIERKLICPDNLSEDKRENIAKLYEKQLDANIFWGRFNENLPNDVGGAGFYTTFSTNMGQVNIYSERFRGNDNLNYTLEQAQLLANRIVDFLIGWLEYELGDDPNFVNLKTFCNENFRPDLKNLMIYFWLSNILEEYKNGASEEIVMRLQHYVIERGYLSPKEMHLLTESSENGEKQGLRLCCQLVADKMGYSLPGMKAERLVFLSDSKHAEDSIKRYIHTMDFFKRAWEEKKLRENDPDAKPPEINVGDLIGHDIDFEFDIFSWSDTQIEVKLACENEPFETNGKWDEQASQVIWRCSITEDEELPTFFFASWSDPNRKYQEEHFGRMVLSGETLAEYCMWREKLDEGKAKEWDSFILSLNPSQELEKQVSSFRFSQDRQNQKESDVQKSDLAVKPRELILTGLKAKKEEKGHRKTQTKQIQPDKKS